MSTVEWGMIVLKGNSDRYTGVKGSSARTPWKERLERKKHFYEEEGVQSTWTSKLGLASSLGVEVRRQTHRERERVDGSARVHQRRCRFRTVVDFGVTAKGIGSIVVVGIRYGGRRRDCVHRGRQTGVSKIRGPSLSGAKS